MAVQLDLQERERELALLERLLRNARDGIGVAVVVEGPAGIGKTRLVHGAADSGRSLGLRVLSARGGQLEQELPFGSARQLFETTLLAATSRQRRAFLAGPARNAAIVLDLIDEVGERVERAAAVHGLFWLVANLAAEQPLLIAVDDLQWVDEPSVRMLAYLARRLDGLPVALVVAVRTGEPAGSTLATFLAAEGHTRIRPEALGPDGVSRLVELRLGRADPELVQSCLARTAGNPFLVAELLTELSELTQPFDASAGLDALVPVPVATSIRQRLGRIGPDAVALAHAMVVVGEDADIGLTAGLAGLGADAATAAAERLVGADLAVLSGGLRFRHQLVRDAIAASIGPADRAAAHGRAARLLDARGAGAERIATHLVSSPPGGGDRRTVAILKEAARVAERQDVPERAAALLRRALAEPPTEDDRLSTLRRLGQAELAALEPGAAERFQAAWELASDPGGRGELALVLGIALYTAGRHAESVRVLLQAIDELDDAHREQRLHLEAYLAIAGRYDLATERAVRGRVRKLAATLTGSTTGERLVLAVAALEAPGVGAGGLAHAAELQERVEYETPWPTPQRGVGTVAMYLHAGRPDKARALAERLLEYGRDTGSPARHAVGLLASSLVHLDVGLLDDAESDLREVLEGSAEAGPARDAAYGGLVLILTERGALDQAQGVLEEHGLDGDLPEQMILNPLLHARGTLRVAQRRWADALADARELGRRHETWHIQRPSPNWRAIAAEALTGLGDDKEAHELAEESLALARTWGTPKAIAIALRARALTADPAQRRADLEAAVATLDATPWLLEHARVSLDLGADLRRANARREARVHLRTALDESARCRAEGLARRAEDELRATGARPRRRAVVGRDALTPSERRVSDLAARGLTNREIAHELFITLATVETHLGRVYRKLDITGRDELDAILSRHDERSP